MKRIFKLFLKENKIETVDRDTFEQLTIEFNGWVATTTTGTSKIKRYAFKALTTKFMIRKWCEQLGILKSIKPC